MLDRIVSAFKAPAAPTPKRDSVRGIVRARSHGNVRLQSGDYYTKKDVDVRFQRIREVEFVD